MKFIIKNTTVKVGFPFFVTAALFLSSGMTNNFISCLLISLLHEFGHLMAMKSFGCEISEISFGLMGIKIEKSNLSLSYFQECVVALCGPLVNLAVSVIIFNLQAVDDIFCTAFNINTGVLIINLLPLSMLDGGRFIQYLLLNFFSLETVKKTINIIEIFVLLFLIALLIFTLIYNIVNEYFIFFVICVVVITVFDMIIR